MDGRKQGRSAVKTILKTHGVLKRFSLFCLTAFLMVGLAIGAILTSSLEKSVIDRSKNETAQVVAEEVDRLFPGMDFSLPMAGPRYEDFQGGVAHLKYHPSIKRIKVWNLDGVVVWSDKRELVGKRFPDNKELLEALNGTISSEITSLNKPENQTERQHPRLLELYIPIRSEPEGKVRAVFEIYQDLEALDADISRQKRILWISIFGGFTAIYFTCFGIFWRASRRLAEQTREIEISEEKSRDLARGLTSLINNVPGIVYRGHRDWSLSFIGAEVETVTGYTPDQFTSGAVGWKEIFHPDDVAQVKEAFRKAGKEKADTLRVEYRIRNRDGGIRWIEDRRQLFYEESGAFAKVEGLLLDITERKETDRKLQESHHRFRALADTASDGIINVDAQGNIIFINPAAERQFGYDSIEVMGKNITILIPERYRSAHQRGMERYLKTGNSRIIGKTVQLEGLRKEGSEFPIELSLATWEWKEGSFFSAIIRDITERKRAEKELRESEDRYRDLVEHSQDLICTHDLSGRILSVNLWASTVLGYAQEELLQMKLRDLIVPEVQHEFGIYLDKIREHGAARGLLLVRTRRGEQRIWQYNNTLRTEGVAEPIVRGMAQDITERWRAEKALIRLNMAVDQISEAVVITDTQGRTEYVNFAFERITGYSREEAIDQNMRILKSGKQDETFYKTMWETITRGESWTGDFTNRKKDGTLYEEKAAISPIRNTSGKIINFVKVSRDMTRERTLERQVRTAQRMESVGTLAGGIAHDFNNALTGILGYSELLRLRVAGDPQGLEELDEVSRAAERAATLTRQLLTFARRQVMEPVNLTLSDVVGELVRFFTKVAGAKIDVKTFLSADTPTIRADRGQIEQVVMNLCLNARDAMPAGGELIVETGAVDLGEDFVREYPYMKKGRYAFLVVSDTGVGMDEATRERVFEPFFTTKTPDKGTGLGLSVVYGIVKQHNGYIHVDSKPGKGSTFKVYFPLVEAPADVRTPVKTEPVRRGSETILLAEDEESIRTLAGRILGDLGYTVLPACNGEEAVDLFRRHGGKIALAILDMVMPRMGGKEAFEAMRKENPGQKVLFMSGYSGDSIHEGFVITTDTPFLGKPFSPMVLARKVREVLDRK